VQGIYKQAVLVYFGRTGESFLADKRAWITSTLNGGVA
jgi:hypothetical protein